MRSDSSTRVKGYEVFFGFREPPFSLAPDTRFLFDGASHAAAREQVTYALERREPLVVVTGEIGTGKTLLCRSVVGQLEHRTFLSIIHDPLLERDDLLKQMLQDFGVISKDRTRLAATSRHDLVHALQEFLLSLAPLQAHAVLVIDEAQHLQPDVMEQLRLISNVHDDAGALLQIILVGQPSLDAVLLRPELRQLKQRVSRHVRLEPLGIAELSQYIDHRLAIARDGGRPKGGATFTPEALSAIWRLSGGTPRVINLLCDRSLEAAYEQQARSVDAPLIDGAAAELGIQRPPVAPAPTAWSAPSAIADYLPEKPAPAEAPQVAAVAAPEAPSEAAPPAPSVVWRDRGDLPVAYEPAAEIETPRRNSRPLVIAAVVIVAAAAAWFGIRGFMSSEPANSNSTSTPAERQPAPSSVPPPVPEVRTPASAPAASAPASASPTAAAPTAAAPTPSAPPPAATSTSAAPAPAPPPAEAPGSFEIVIASFRTVTRPSEVAAELTAHGQRVRQRTIDGWEQVLAGPFPTREAAVAAQEQLDRAGYTGTQIVPAPR